MKSQQRIKTETDRHRAHLIGEAASNLDTAHDLRFEVQIPANIDIPATDHHLINSIQAEYGIMILLQIAVLMAIAFHRR
ncbi:hypothetical protein PMG71_13960 [Roseofilum sp. BLCC_M154]|uniref:Uncharacterized protein n=1 Tax=Roseofilum acuticapitatum BLCC-M154 TaxID=3022444 RepID=A0ABT7AUG0_9CYAN|nr:hypothetical protein [Roseofilum acuticapitatum]MDJ1170535.1 hypothetical protein [Roseofilum acuticapitatum BLCC-M154]